MAHPQPTTYTSKSGKTFTYDARKLLDIDSIDTKCGEIISEAETSCKKICKKMKNVKIGKEVMCVADKSLEPALDEISKYIDNISKVGITNYVDQYKDAAAQTFSILQQQEDARAKADCDAEDARYSAQQSNQNG